MTVYGCILVENNADAGSRLLFATGFQVRNKNNLPSKVRLKLFQKFIVYA